MNIRIFFALGAIVIFSGCFGLLSSENNPASPSDHMNEFIDESLAEKEEKKEFKKEMPPLVVNKDERKAAEMYGDLVCIVADPAFWEGFFSDEESGEELDEAKFYAEHGYSGEADAKVAIEKYWGKKNFKSVVKSRIGEKCAEGVASVDINIDEVLEQEKPDLE